MSTLGAKFTSAATSIFPPLRANMAILRSDDSELPKKLDLLPRELRSAFAAACAQRLLPHYRDFAVRTSGGLVKTRTTNDPGRLEQILTDFWAALEGEVDRTALRKWYDMCEALIPNDYEQGMDGAGPAEHAIFATMSAISAQISGNSQEAVWASEQACEAIYHHISARLYDPGDDHSAFVDKVDSDPLMQAECSRQQRDLADLRAVSEQGWDHRVIISAIRRRAEQEPIVLT
jgi:hypothetical protein